MIVVPTRRWLIGAGLLALAVLPALRWPHAAGLLPALDLLWIAALALDFVLDARTENARDQPRSARGVRVPAAPPSCATAGGTAAGAPCASTSASVCRTRSVEPRRPPGTCWCRRAKVWTSGSSWCLPGAASVTAARSRFGCVGRSASPGGRARCALPWSVTVYPTVPDAPLRALPLQVARRRREAGLRDLRRPGEGRLFEGLREWVPGDETRIIDWKATARRGKPIARQYEDERRQQVLIVIDAGRLLTAEVDGVARLESVVTAALQLARAAVEHDDNVGLMVFADEIQRYVAPARGRRALRAVLEGLARTEGRLVESDYPAAFRYLAAHNRKRALTVLFTDVIDRTASEALVRTPPRSGRGTFRSRSPSAIPRSRRWPPCRPASDRGRLRARGRRGAARRARGGPGGDARARRAGPGRGAGGAAEAVVARYHGLKRRGLALGVAGRGRDPRLLK